MTIPSCPKCDAKLFEMKTIEPRGSRVKVNTIGCAACGAVVGVVDFTDIPTVLKAFEKRVDEKLDRIIRQTRG